MPDKTRFVRALRPFSLIVAIATCGLGVSLALVHGGQDHLLALLVILNGLLLQIAVNLINDHRDISLGHFTEQQCQAIRRNTRVGYLVMLVAIAIGLYLVSLRGWPLLLLGLVGVFGAWAYTGGQINYKSRGLGVLLVFFLMGVMLIGGSYYVVTGEYRIDVFWLSLPFSLLSSLLLLANELRDYEQDLAQGIKTLSVRLGYEFGVKLYYTLVALTYFISALLYQAGMLHQLLLILVTAFALWQPIKALNYRSTQRQRLAPLTGRFYLVFSGMYLLTIWMAPA